MSMQRLLMAMAAGVAIGLLIAPAKGSETRQKLSDTADTIRNRFRNLRGVTAEELDELRDIFEHEVSGLRDDIRERVLELVTAARASSNNIRKAAMS